jgi:hypothetical protein
VSLEWKLACVGCVVCLITYSSATEHKGNERVTMPYGRQHNSPLDVSFNYMSQLHYRIHKATEHF